MLVLTCLKSTRTHQCAAYSAPRKNGASVCKTRGKALSLTAPACVSDVAVETYWQSRDSTSGPAPRWRDALDVATDPTPRHLGISLSSAGDATPFCESTGGSRKGYAPGCDERVSGMSPSPRRGRGPTSTPPSGGLCRWAKSGAGGCFRHARSCGDRWKGWWRSLTLTCVGKTPVLPREALRRAGRAAGRTPH